MSADDFAVEAAGPSAPTVETSRLAIFAMFSGVVCIPGLSGLLGISLGLMALRQISRSQYIVGANIAWMGILSGCVNVAGWGAVANRYLSIREESTAAATAFMTAWAKSEADGEAAAGPGFAPMMHRGSADGMRAEMLKRLGPFQGVGERADYSYKIRHEGMRPFDEATATFPLLFQSGAPVLAAFDLGYTGSELKIIGYRITSPVLADVEHDKTNELHGTAAPEISEFGTGLPKVDPRGMKGFNKH